MAARPIPQPNPKIVAGVRAYDNLSPINALCVLADGGHDDYKHDPANNVHENKETIVLK